MNGFKCFLGAVAASSILLLAGCGGGDHGTGPHGGGQYDLVGINEDGLPESEIIEDCTETLFTAGSLSMDGNSWEMEIDWEKAEGTNSTGDYGTFQRNGSQLRFHSAAYGDQFEGEIEGSLVVLHYDFCANGEVDVDLVFE